MIFLGTVFTFTNFNFLFSLRRFQYYNAADTVSRTQFGADHPVSLHVQQHVAHALHGVGEFRKAIEVIKVVLGHMKKQKEREDRNDRQHLSNAKKQKGGKAQQKRKKKGDQDKVAGVVKAGTIGGVTSLLYGWNGSKPDPVVCKMLLKHFMGSLVTQRNQSRRSNYRRRR